MPVASQRNPVRSWGLNPAKVRLISGLVLFAYVTLHLADNALLNVSIEAAEAMLRGMKLAWQSLPGAIVLYSALLAHLALAFWALYVRRRFQWRPAEMVQLALGFCIPVLLVNHILATRVSLSLFGTEKGYPIELWSFWVSRFPAPDRRCATHLSLGGAEPGVRSRRTPQHRGGIAGFHDWPGDLKRRISPN